MSNDRDEVGNQLYRGDHVGQGGAEREAGSARQPTIGPEPSQEHNAVRDEADEIPSPPLRQEPGRLLNDVETCGVVLDLRHGA